MEIDRKKIKVCYLCGEHLSGKISNDHVPPRQLFSKAIRKCHHPNLTTIPVHDYCNKAYQTDEDYFVYSLGPLAIKTYAGKSISDDIQRKLKVGKQKALSNMTFKEWEKRPSGLILPGGLIAKRIDGARIHRVAWKIVRGLFFINEKKVLPINKPNIIEYVGPDQTPPEEFRALKSAQNKGLYPGVFDYRYACFQQIHGYYYWSILFWDAFIVLMGFHNPECECDTCKRVSVII